MRSSRSVALVMSQVVAAAFLVGCEPPPKPAPPPPPPAVATPQQAQQIQHQINQFGAAHVGRVNIVSAADNLAAITGIPMNAVKMGDTISILDDADKVVANGTITYMHEDKETQTPAIVITYQPSPDGGRAPMKGDLAVTQLAPH